MPFELPKLDYAYDALEPAIDAKTMEIHHTKHHAGYTNNLNLALEKHPELDSETIEYLLMHIDDVPEEIRTAVRNNGGGFHNHSLYWKVMTPSELKTSPSGDFEKMFISTFESKENFEQFFSKEATTRFGSGWAWLVMDGNKDLEILSTPNQDSPLMNGLTPILGIDVWEHAYYLNYQNRRPDYIKNWLELVNWEVVSEIYNSA